MKFALWCTSAPSEGSDYQELFCRRLAEVGLAGRIGVDQVWFLEDHPIPTSATPSPAEFTPRLLPTG